MIRLLTALAAGAAAMFLLDPADGRRRRARLRDKFVSAGHAARRVAAARGGYLADRSRGLVAEARAVVRHDILDDEQLEARVRSRLGRVASHPHAIETSASGDVVSLGGIAPADEIDAILAAVARVPGVGRVDSALEAGDPEAAPRRRRGGTAGTRAN